MLQLPLHCSAFPLRPTINAAAFPLLFQQHSTAASTIWSVCLPIKGGWFNCHTKHLTSTSKSGKEWCSILCLELVWIAFEGFFEMFSNFSYTVFNFLVRFFNYWFKFFSVSFLLLFVNFQLLCWRNLVFLSLLLEKIS